MDRGSSKRGVGDGVNTLSAGRDAVTSRELAIAADAEGDDVSAGGVVVEDVEGSGRLAAGGRGCKQREDKPDGGGETHIGEVEEEIEELI